MKRCTHPFILIMAFFMVVGIFFSFLGFCFLKETNSFKEDAMITEATITSIDERFHGGDTDYDVYVSYTVDGVSYNEELNSYSSSMKVGDTVTIYYNPSDPRDIMSAEDTILSILPLIIGGIFILIPLIVLLVIFKKRRKKLKVKQYGYIVQANIVDVVLNRKIRSNRTSPYYIVASIIGPDGLKYEFTSDNYYGDIPGLIEYYNIRTIPVYVNPTNFKEYFVDAESLKKYFP